MAGQQDSLPPQSPHNIFNQRVSTQVIHKKIRQITAEDHSVIYGTRECNICMNEFDPNAIEVSLIKPCNHTSHEGCLAHSFVANTTQIWAKCPNCRGNVTEIITIQDNNDFTTETPEDFINRVLPGNLISDAFQRRPSFQTPLSQRQRVGYSYNVQSNYGSPGVLLRSIPVGIRDNIQVAGQDPVNQVITVRQENMNSQFCGIYTGTLFMCHSNSLEEVLNSDTIYILDISGSMRSILNDLKQVLINIITNINSLQRVSLILFDQNAYHLSPLQRITIENRASIIAKINSITDGGSTNFNPAFSLLENVLIDAEETTPGRKKIVIFLSDGANDDHLNTNLLDNIFERFPELSMNTLSYGSGINANQSLIPILRDRQSELGKYYHLTTSVDFDRAIREINNDNSDTYARNITICFSGAKPIIPNLITNTDSTFSVILPGLNTNSEIMIPYVIISDTIRISYSYTLADCSIINGIFLLDDTNILPEVLTKFFPRKSFVNQKIIEITKDHGLDDATKHAALNELLNLVTQDSLGDFYMELNTEINKIMQSFIYSDNDTQNYATQALLQYSSGGVTPGLARAMSSGVRRTQTQTSPNPFEDEDEN